VAPPVSASPRGQPAAGIGKHGGGRQSICLFGLFGLGNFGNDGSLEAMVHMLRQIVPNAVLSCICVDPQKIQEDHDIATVPISLAGFSHPLLRLVDKAALTIPGRLANWLRTIRYVRQFDAMIIPGTSILCDYRAGPLGAPYGLFRWSSAAKISGTKVYFVSTGAARMHHRASRWMLTRVARMADYRSFRDSNSREFVARLGVDTQRDEVYPDLVFRLPAAVPAARASSDSGLVTIGIGMMDYQGWRAWGDDRTAIYMAYLNKMARFIFALRERGYRVRLLIGEVADERAVADVQTILGGRCQQSSNGAGELVAEPVNSLHDLMRQIGDTSLVVASRFHNLICAMKMMVPAISVGYEPKNDALLREMGLGAFCHHIERFDDEQLMEQVAALLERREVHVGLIRQKLASIEKSIMQQERLLAALLAAIPTRPG
jgi:polysaccharide pyruvyl transferase WcaK-like protein